MQNAPSPSASKARSLLSYAEIHLDFRSTAMNYPVVQASKTSQLTNPPLWFRALCQELKTPKAVVTHLTKGIDTELVYEIPKPFDHVLYLLLTFALQK